MKYNVGDKVRVKSWQQMADEYGTNDVNDIFCDQLFVPEMSQWCGRIMTVEEINYTVPFYYMAEDTEDWAWTDDMLEDINTTTISSEKNSFYPTKEVSECCICNWTPVTGEWLIVNNSKSYICPDCARKIAKLIGVKNDI